MLSAALERRIRSARLHPALTATRPAAKRGAEIFAKGDYPSCWDEFVGQTAAITYLKASIRSARARGTRLDHVLLASGMGGVGKTSLAKLIAAEMGVGILEMSGRVSVDDARTALLSLRDHDVLFYDEVHQAVSGGRERGEWLLHLLQDGGLMTPRGFEPMPDITVVAATTDAQRLPATILGRFRIRPQLTAYDDAAALAIVRTLSERLGLGTDVPLPTDEQMLAVAAASNGSPRDMQALLVALRDTYYAADPPAFDVDLALSWVGVSRDGLTRLAQDFLIALLTLCGGKASLATIAGLLSEPGPLHQTEQILQSKGFLQIETGGRALTDDGTARALDLLRERGLREE